MNELAFRLFRTGVRPTHLRVRRIFSEAVDRYLGITTTDEDVAERLGYDITIFRQTWRALGWTTTWRLLSRLPAGPESVFLDLGCGAGRITCAAARRGYARVIGVDIAPDFAGLAADNLRQLRLPHAPATVACTDATTYEVPSDVTVVFLYNPFQGAILDAALEQVYASFDRSPRPITIAYANPAEHERLTRSKRLKPTRRLQLSWRPGEDWLRTQAVQLYEVVAAR